jgi:hypothetical protein
MMDLNKEAEEWAGIDDINDEILSSFIVGANSKYVQAKIIQAQIDVLKPYLEWNTEVALSIQRDIDRFEQQLKQLKNEI